MTKVGKEFGVSRVDLVTGRVHQIVRGRGGMAKKSQVWAGRDYDRRVLAIVDRSDGRARQTEYTIRDEVVGRASARSFATNSGGLALEFRVCVC